MLVNAVYQISEQPLIWLSIGSKNWNKLENKTNSKAYLLIHPMWYFSFSSVIPHLKYRAKLRKKNIILIILSNSRREHIFSSLLGFKSVFLNQNMHVCEYQFTIEHRPKKYDAVYIAAAKKYKRIHLAAKISSLFIITYFWPIITDENGNWNLHEFEPRIKHANYNKKRMDKAQIRTIISESKCGLALSKKEGAMLASMEYLLSGIPIVTTKSIGGRNHFFDNRYVKTVRANPTAVKKGVDVITSLNIEPEFIRNETLKKIEKERRKFYNFIKALHAKGSYIIEPYNEFSKRIWGHCTGLENNRII